LSSWENSDVIVDLEALFFGLFPRKIIPQFDDLGDLGQVSKIINYSK